MKLVVKDTMSKGLTFDENSNIIVKIKAWKWIQLTMIWFQLKVEMELQLQLLSKKRIVKI